MNQEIHSQGQIIGGGMSKRGQGLASYCERPSKRKATLDQFIEAQDRTESIKYPFCAVPCTLTSEFLKRLLLKSYLQLGRLHKKKGSLEGHFSWKNFIVSDPLEIVELEDVQPVKLTPSGCKADRETFAILVSGLFDNVVPEDVKIWLHNMDQGWEDDLLLHHVYMKNRHTTYGEFITLYQCLLELESCDHSKYTRFLESLQIYNNWYEDGFNWSILQETKKMISDYKKSDIYRRKKMEMKKENLSRHNVKGVLKTIKKTWMGPAKELHEYFLAVILGEYPQLLSAVQKALYVSGYYGDHLSI